MVDLIDVILGILRMRWGTATSLPSNVGYQTWHPHHVSKAAALEATGLVAWVTAQRAKHACFCSYAESKQRCPK